MEILNVLAYHCYNLVVFMGTSLKSFPRKISSSCWHPMSISDKGDPTKFFFQTFPFTFREHLPWDRCAYILMTFLFILLRTASWDGKKSCNQVLWGRKEKRMISNKVSYFSSFSRWFNLARLPTCKSGCNQFCNLKLTKVKNYRNYKQSSKNISSVSDFLDLCLLWFTALFLWWSHETYLSWQ